jgi:hypothetical protein
LDESFEITGPVALAVGCAVIVIFLLPGATVVVVDKVIAPVPVAGETGELFVPGPTELIVKVTEAMPVDDC